jgi:hypothetical protein
MPFDTEESESCENPSNGQDSMAFWIALKGLNNSRYRVVERLLQVEVLTIETSKTSAVAVASIGSSKNPVCRLCNLLTCVLALVIPSAEANGQALKRTGATDPCYVLNPAEVSATLRGPGMVVVVRRLRDMGLDECQMARISRPAPASLEEAVQRIIKTDSPLLAVMFSDSLGSKGFDLFPARPEISQLQVPGLGDRAVFQNGFLLVARGQNFLVIGLIGRAPSEDERNRSDLIDLAREALATSFDGSKLIEFKLADRAIANDRAAFEADPKSFALIRLNMLPATIPEAMGMARLEQARSYNLLALTADPNDTDVLYVQGVLDWAVAYKLRMQVRSRLSLPPQQALENKASCAEVKEKNQQKVEEGISVLTKAVKLRPDFGAAMAYLNLLFRERADYECADPGARSADLKMADGWVQAMLTAMSATKKSISANPSPQVLIPLPPPPPLPPPITEKDGEPVRVKVAQDVTQGLLVKKVEPVYPPLARQARVQGPVLLQAEIGPTAQGGSIRSCQAATARAPLRASSNAPSTGL